MAPQITAPRSLGEKTKAMDPSLLPQKVSTTTSSIESSLDLSIPTTLISPPSTTQSNFNIHTRLPKLPILIPSETATPRTNVPFNPTSLSLPSGTNVLASSSSIPVSPQSSQTGTIQVLDMSSLLLSSTTISSSILPADSPTASSEAPPTADIPGSPKHNTSRNRILGIAIITPILLICTGLIALYIWHRRRTRAILLRPYRTSQNGVADYDSCGESQTVTPFILSEKVQSANGAVVTIGAADTKRRVPATNTNVRSKGLSVRRLLNSMREGALAPTGAQYRVPKVPAEQSNIQNNDPRLVSESIHPHDGTSRIVRASLLHEADVLRLQESSLTQNVGLDSNVRYTTRGSEGSIDAELRAYIPPPKYTSTGSLEHHCF